MNKLSVKRIFGLIILIGIIVSIIYLQYEHNVRKNKDIMIKRHNKQYIKELSCMPNKPMNKGIIYAEAMKQYWNWEMNNIWNMYENKQGEHPLGIEEGLIASVGWATCCPRV